MDLTGRRIVLCVTGGIAAYKSVEVCRRLIDAGAHVTPIMTESATKFLGPTTLSALASEPVRVQIFDDGDPIPHTGLGQGADLVLVVPATARSIAAYSVGLSDDLVTATLIATRAPVVICPAMHTEMWEHPSVVDNVATLVRRGVTVVPPGVGHLAGGDVGAGRLAEPSDIVATVVRTLSPGRLANKHVVVTAGGTREPIDPVRYIGNRSSGKQGHAVARAAADQGAKVTLITAADQPIPYGVTLVEVETAEQMRDAVLAASAGADVVVMAAAVADFRPVAVAGRKLKKQDGLPEIVLAANKDILAELGANRSEGLMLVGFAAETNDVVANAVEKLERKNIDMIIANDVHEVGAGFSTDTNRVTIITHGHQVEVKLGSKYEIAQAVISSICDHLELD